MLADEVFQGPDHSQVAIFHLGQYLLEIIEKNWDGLAQRGFDVGRKFSALAPCLNSKCPVTEDRRLAFLRHVTHSATQIETEKYDAFAR